MHRFPADKADIPIWVADGYDWAKRLVLECDGPGATFGLSSNRNDLDARLSGGLLDWLKRTWSHFGFKHDFSDMFPCIVPVFLGQAGLNMTLGVEAYFHRRAVDDGKSVEFLETESDFLDACNSAKLGRRDGGRRNCLHQVGHGPPAGYKADNAPLMTRENVVASAGKPTKMETPPQSTSVESGEPDCK